MTPFAQRSLAGFKFPLWLIPFTALMAVGSARAEDIKVEVILVWATSDEDDKKDAEKKHKELSQIVAKELKEPFKWKYYFEVNKKSGEIASRSSKAFRVSSKCEVKVTELAGPDVIVELFGEGKPVNRIKEGLHPGKLISIGQAEKQGGAWFVVVHRPK